MSRAEVPVQYNFGDLNRAEGEPLTAYLVPEGTCLWPKNKRRGYVTREFYAERLGHEVEGLTGFRARDQFTLFFDGNYRTYPQGTTFGTYANTLRKRKI